MTEWQPIETAPRDGTKILGTKYNHLTGHQERAVIFWAANTWLVAPSKDYRLSHLATHWMPLPAPSGENDDLC